MKLVSLHHVSVSYDKVPVLTDVDLISGTTISSE